MTQHLEQCQLRVQYDLARYSCEGQEHYGKILKQIVKMQTNFRMGSKSKKKIRTGKDKGKLEESFDKSYIEQAAAIMAYRKHLNGQVAVKPSEYSIQKRDIQEWTRECKEHQKKKTKPPVPKTKAKRKRRRQVKKAVKKKLDRRTTTQNSQWMKTHTPQSKLKVELQAELLLGLQAQP